MSVTYGKGTIGEGGEEFVDGTVGDGGEADMTEGISFCTSLLLPFAESGAW
jgi:hypothetical protein